MDKPEPMRTEGKRYIEMTTAEWIGRLLMPVNTFPKELKEGCGEIHKLRQEKEIKLAVEYAIQEIEKEKKLPYLAKRFISAKLKEAFGDIL